MDMTKSVKEMQKRDSNVTEGYKFVSIDDFYEQVALVAARDHDLGWRLSERYSEEQRFVCDRNDTHIRKVYAVDLLNSAARVRDFSFISVTMPYEGATTAGKMLSYADKAFMRELFKIPTGEAEADADRQVTKSERSSQKNAGDKDSFFKKEGTE